METEIARLVRACYQCGRCAGGCPFALAMQHTPRLLIRLIQLGALDEALQSNTIWLCAGCYSCTMYCPRGIDLTDLMYRLKRLAIARGIVNVNVWFYREFIANLSKRGIVYEPELMLRYARRVGWRTLLPHVAMGIHLVQKGGLNLPPRGRAGSDTLARVVNAILRGEKEAR